MSSRGDSSSLTCRFWYPGKNRCTACSNALRTRAADSRSLDSTACARIQAANSPRRSSRGENASAKAAAYPPATADFVAARSEGTARLVENSTASGRSNFVPLATGGGSPTKADLEGVSSVCSRGLPALLLCAAAAYLG